MSAKDPSLLEECIAVLLAAHSDLNESIKWQSSISECCKKQGSADPYKVNFKRAAPYSMDERVEAAQKTQKAVSTLIAKCESLIKAFEG